MCYEQVSADDLTEFGAGTLIQEITVSIMLQLFVLAPTDNLESKDLEDLGWTDRAGRC